MTRDLVAVVERGAAVDVLAVHRVEQSAGLVAEPELRPDVVDALDAVELEPRGARALAQAGEEADGDAHVIDLARTAYPDLEHARPLVGAWSSIPRSARPIRPCAARTCAASAGSSRPTRPPRRRSRADRLLAGARRHPGRSCSSDDPEPGDPRARRRTSRSR